MNDLFSIDIQTLKFQSLLSKTGGVLPQVRYGLGFTSAGGRLWILGGGGYSGPNLLYVRLSFSSFVGLHLLSD